MNCARTPTEDSTARQGQVAGGKDEMGEDAPAERPVQQVETDIGWEAQGAYEVLS